MGLSDLFKSPVQAAINSVVEGASGIIKDFKADPTKVAEYDERLKELQITAQEKSDEVVVQLADIHQKDIDSARNMNMLIATSSVTPKLDKIAPYLLAMFITFGFFGLLAFMLFRPVPIENKDIMNILLGSLGTAWICVVHFFFSSSAGSKDKDETIKSLSQTP